MSSSFLTQFGGNELAKKLLHGTASCEHTPGRLLISTSLDGLGYQGDPGVEYTVPETPERFSESHIADDVESGEVYMCQRRLGTWDPCRDLLNQSHMLAGSPLSAKGFMRSTNRST